MRTPTPPERPWETGCLQVYTGDGKGKTTAALGLALRAAGAGLRVFIAQFAKGRDYSELAIIPRLAEFVVLKQYGRALFLRGEPSPEDIAAARQGLSEVRDILVQGKFDLVVLDEANIATHFGLFTVDELIATLDARAPTVEVVVTGRKADPRLLQHADLVTEMREVKHYYQHGVTARKGIEN